MINLRKLTLPLAFALAACGGGGTANPSETIVALYGDSYSTGYAGEVLAANLPSTYKVFNYSVGGATTVNITTGVWRPDQVANKPFDNISSSLKQTTANVVLLRYGIAEAVLVGTDVFEVNITNVIKEAISLNKTVILINIPTMPITHGITENLSNKFDTINASLARVSASYNVPLIDLHSTVTISVSDMWTDGLHILPDTTKRVSEEIAKQLKTKL